MAMSCSESRSAHTQVSDSWQVRLEQHIGLEPIQTAWKAVVLPLHQCCICSADASSGAVRCPTSIPNTITSPRHGCDPRGPDTWAAVRRTAYCRSFPAVRKKDGMKKRFVAHPNGADCSMQNRFEQVGGGLGKNASNGIGTVICLSITILSIRSIEINETLHKNSC